MRKIAAIRFAPFSTESGANDHSETARSRSAGLVHETLHHARTVCGALLVGLMLTGCVNGGGGSTASIDVGSGGAPTSASYNAAGSGTSGVSSGPQTLVASNARPAAINAANPYFSRQAGAQNASLPIGAPPSPGQDYRVAPLDVLEISVFQVEELNKKVRVSPSGQISLPLVGTINAAGLTVAQLERDVARRLGERYLQSPQVSVFIEDSTYNRITVEGAVKTPGVFPTSGGALTLVQAIALAGGPAWVADPSSIVVFRTDNGKRMAARFDLPEIRKGDMGDPMLIAGDIVVVPESGWRSGLTDWNALMGALPSAGAFALL